MASFVKTENGNVRAFVYMVKHGRVARISKTFKRKKDAEDWAFTFEVARNSGQDLFTRQSKFSEFYDWWVRNVKRQDVKESTYVHYRQYGKRVATMFGGYKVSDMNHALVQQLFDEYGETHSQKTVHEFATVVKACIKYAVGIGAIQVDWTHLIKAHGTLVKKRNLALSITEMKKLREYCFEHADEEFCLFILLALESGLRRGEILGLTPDNLREDDGDYLVQVRHSKSPHVKSLSLKTKQARRDVSIGGKVFKMVKAIPVKQDGYIFAEDGFHQSEMLKPILEELDLPATTIHGLRDTNASFLFSQGIDIVSVSQRLGHANINITQQYYIQLMPEKKHAQDGRVRELFDLL
ncbi:tyrosine-type recombinase/integrase [Lacticaseibacillus saniviri]